MTGPVPRFPPTPPPLEWDQLTLYAATVFLEAEGEPNEGKVAVAWVIRNRADRRGQTIPDVILAPAQFSCWNTDYRRQAMRRLSRAAGPAVEACWRAAAGALWRLLPDPVEGAQHYLNVEEARRQRGGTLPEWANLSRAVGIIGRHTFLP